MKKIYLFLVLCVFVSCSDDNSTSNPNVTKEAIIGNWKLKSKNRVNSSDNIATSCEIEKGRMMFTESNHGTRVVGILDSQNSTCNATSFNSTFYVLPNVIRLESGNNKNVYASKIVSGELYMTLTSTSNSSGNSPVPVENQITEVYVRM